MISAAAVFYVGLVRRRLRRTCLRVRDRLLSAWLRWQASGDNSGTPKSSSRCRALTQLACALTQIYIAWQGRLSQTPVPRPQCGTQTRIAQAVRVRCGKFSKRELSTGSFSM